MKPGLLELLNRKPPLQNRRFKWWEHVTKTYVATDVFPREIGKKLGRLKQARETSDYDDFYIASLAETTEQYRAAEMIVAEVKRYLSKKGIQY